MRFLLQVAEMKKEWYIYDWLPQNQSVWYLKKTCSLQKKIKVNILVLRFLTSSMAHSPSLDINPYRTNVENRVSS